MLPEIIAHRGGALLWPENSLLACRNAAALGVHQVQVDVHLSGDGEVVVLHDATLDRTTEGTGPVFVRSWAELSAIALRDAPGETVPSLAAVAGTLIRSNARLRLEIKRRFDGSAYETLPERLLHVLHDFGLLGRAVVTSFHWSELERVRILAPQLPLVWLLDASATSAWCEASAEAAKRLHRTMIGVRYDRLTSVLRQRLSLANLDLCCFGANDLASLEACFEVDAREISTDRPDLALHLRERR